MNQNLLAEAMIGSWELLSRTDRATDGSLRDEPTLGSDPVALLVYTKTKFAAQFMKRDRSALAVSPGQSGTNNTTASGGYDAYFGTYRVLGNGEVLHRLEAALSPANVGIEVSRRLRVDDGRLTIELATTASSGEAVVRTLLWRKVP